MRVVRRAARAILIDGNGRLVLFRRTLPKRKPYWSTPGGGVDREDGSVEAALHRELAEELGATVDRVQQVFLTSPPRGDGIAVSHFFVCRLVSMDLSKRTGEEFTNPAKGRYDVGRIDLRGKKLNRYALQPPEAKEFILARRQALLVAALTDDAPPLTLASPAATAPPAWSAATGACAPEPAPDDAATPDQTITADETVSTDQAGTAGEATMSQHANSDDAGTPDCGSSAPTPAPATMNAGKVAERRPRRAMPPILEIVDGAVVNDGSDPPTRALPRPRRWPRWPFHR